MSRIFKRGLGGGGRRDGRQLLALHRLNLRRRRQGRGLSGFVPRGDLSFGALVLQLLDRRLRLPLGLIKLTAQQGLGGVRLLGLGVLRGLNSSLRLRRSINLSLQSSFHGRRGFLAGDLYLLRRLQTGCFQCFSLFERKGFAQARSDRLGLLPLARLKTLSDHFRSVVGNGLFAERTGVADRMKMPDGVEDRGRN